MLVTDFFFFSFLAPSVTVKAIGLFLKNSALHSRVSSCSSKSSKSNGGGILDVQQQTSPLKFYPNTKQTLINYHSQGNLTSTDRTKQTFVKTSSSPHRISSNTVQHTTTTTANGQKLMPT
jgi:hypothetical protein